MKHRFLTKAIAAVTAAIIVISCSKSDEKLPDKPVLLNLTQGEVNVVESGNSFAFDFFRTIMKGTGNGVNVIISPLSVSSALSMAMNGASGATRDSILKALRLEGSAPDSINSSYKSLTGSLLTVDKRVLISIANSVWTEKDFPAKQAFIDLLKKWYSAETEAFDIDDPGTPAIMNKWIEDNTNGLIKNMVDRLDHNTIMVLINAIYFKGKWKDQFDASKTTDMPFYKAEGTPISVPMMKQENDFSVYKGDKFTMAEFPYGQGNFVMDVILPDQQEDISSLAASLDSRVFAASVSGLRSQKVDLFFPRFKFGFKQDLIDILTGMGMGVAFTDQADFSNISDKYRLYINKALHQAFIETNEEGTEAAAATVIGIGVVSMPSVLELKLDRPFLFVIREISTNAILFMGRVSDPSAS